MNIVPSSPDRGEPDRPPMTVARALAVAAEAGYPMTATSEVLTARSDAARLIAIRFVMRHLMDRTGGSWYMPKGSSEICRAVPEILLDALESAIFDERPGVPDEIGEPGPGVTDAIQSPGRLVP